MRAIVHRSTIDGAVDAPASKSYTHRAMVSGLLSSGKTRIRNPLLSDDTITTLRISEMMGAEVHRGNDVEIIGPTVLKAPTSEIDCHGSGTTLRIFTALSALTSGRCLLTGDNTLRRRPIGDLLEGLRQLGVDAKSVGGNDRPPVEIRGKGLTGGTVRIRGDVSSQYITGLLFACSRAKGDSKIELKTKLESRPYVEMTLDIMHQFDADAEPSDDWSHLIIPGNQDYQAQDYSVEGDFSSAAFLLAAGALAGRVSVKGLRVDSVQGDAAVVRLLKTMESGVKPGKDSLTVLHNEIQAINIDASDIPDLVPVMAVLATQANGTTTIFNAGRLRLKESDRLASTSQELCKMGAEIIESEDGLAVKGPTQLHGAVLDSHDDHRIAMAGVIAGLVADGPTVVENIECVTKSYPGFIRDIQSIGAQIELDSGGIT
ncbi:MAG: 3-phosphoshikimate 1-carboxyvinyltransferase [Candidatus Thorarchaeota archaeon]|jgi:3-phosphoshikimate 1-carboxyvinyltransferase